MEVSAAIKKWLFQHIQHTASMKAGIVPEFYIGLSGGLDSTVLLHALQQTLVTPPFSAVHVHHNLSPHADQWAIHCQQLAQNLSVPFQLLKVNAKPQSGESPEAAARQARYDAFNSLLPAGTTLVLAHHANDQAETVLLQLLRGAGVKGLSGMPALAAWRNKWIARPFLQVTRSELENYADLHQLSWIEDESNFDVCFDRNYLRHQIMPLMTARWPGTIECLSRSAGHCAEAETLLVGLAHEDIKFLTEQTKEANPLILNINILKKLPPSRIKNLLRQWIHSNHFPLPSTVKLQTVIDSSIDCAHDRIPCITWKGGEIRRFRDALYLMEPLPAHDPGWVCEWDLQQDLVLPANLGMLRCSDYQELSCGQKLTVRFRQGGETLYLPERGGHHSLKKLMQEWHIPPWMRARIPLIFRGEALARVELSHIM